MKFQFYSGFNPSEKNESQLGLWHSQLNGKSSNSMVPNHQPVWVYMGSSSYKTLNIIHQPTSTNHCQPLLTITKHTWLLPHMYRKQCVFLVTNVMGGKRAGRPVHPRGLLGQGPRRVGKPHCTSCTECIYLGATPVTTLGVDPKKKTAKLKERRFVSLQLSVSLDATMFRSLDSDWCQNWRRRNS